MGGGDTARGRKTALRDPPEQRELDRKVVFGGAGRGNCKTADLKAFGESAHWAKAGKG